MRLKNSALLEGLFTLKGDFAPGIAPVRKEFGYGVEAAPFRGGALAACTISADFEMGWGWRSMGVASAEAMGALERRQVPSILSLLDEYSIPITWATVGHLFLESCDRDACGLAHSTMPRPRKTDRSWKDDWYACDPCSNVRESPSWYASDLIAQIAASPVAHELGTHSFSHISFPTEFASDELVARELQECARAMHPFGVKPRSLVFPRNLSEFAYLPELAAAGIVAVRHREKTNVRLSYPERTANGVYKIYESMNLRIARRYDYLQKVKIFVQKAMSRSAVYSLWFHPSDPAEWFNPMLRQILQYLAVERQSGRLWVATLQQLAAYCEVRERISVRVTPSETGMALSLDIPFDAERFGPTDVTLLIPVDRTPVSVIGQTDGGVRTSVPVNGSAMDVRKLAVTVPASTVLVSVSFV
jgi:peptidoglycan/xylan/chitin deacetylase (PgdA/CDA1 family)